MSDHQQPRSQAADWWRNAVIYQIYPRSFADSNADGIGDLNGILGRLPYVLDLGVDAIWLSPFYPSPLADGGYDITDYRDIDPRLGSLADFDALIEEIHHLGLRLLIDIVPNHTSEKHPWFQAALTSPPGSAERDRYIFRAGKGPRGEQPPTDWRSHFGGSAWERVPDGEWYCHLFAREQPDMNWGNEEVRDYFLGTLRFWADRGVDGFRIDVAHALAKDLSEPLRSQPNLDQALPLDGSDPLYDREEVHEIYQTWRSLFNEYDPPRMAVAETWHPTTSRTYLYARPTELAQVFDFSLLKAGWNASQFKNVIQRSMDGHHGVGGGLTWVLSSHDVPRHPSRYGLPPDADLDLWLRSNGTAYPLDADQAVRRARAATLLMLALPGSAYLYQGEELGLLEVADLPENVLRDPVWERTGRTLKGRDGCRVPLPWTPTGTSFGFGDNGSWLPQPAWFGTSSAQSEDGIPDSTLELYRAALHQRRNLQGADDTLEWLPTDEPETLWLRRPGNWQCLVNFSTTPILIPTGRVLLSSGPMPENSKLPSETAVWLTGPPASATPTISASEHPESQVSSIWSATEVELGAVWRHANRGGDQLRVQGC